MDYISKHSKVFSSSTRSHIFEIISRAKTPIEVAELTQILSLNHNAIRQHLNKLKDSGLVLEKKVSKSKRGRPKFVYMLSAEGESIFHQQEAYVNLSIGLLNILSSQRSPADVGRDIGVLIAEKRSKEQDYSSDPVGYISQEMARQGFHPVVRKDLTTGFIELQHCPLELAAVTDSRTVCQYHLGIAQGLAQTIGGIKIDYLDPKDPSQAGCILKVEEV